MHSALHQSMATFRPSHQQIYTLKPSTITIFSVESIYSILGLNQQRFLSSGRIYLSIINVNNQSFSLIIHLNFSLIQYFISYSLILNKIYSIVLDPMPTALRVPFVYFISWIYQRWYISEGVFRSKTSVRVLRFIHQLSLTSINSSVLLFFYSVNLAHLPLRLGRQEGVLMHHRINFHCFAICCTDGRTHGRTLHGRTDGRTASES